MRSTKATKSLREQVERSARELVVSLLEDSVGDFDELVSECVGAAAMKILSDDELYVWSMEDRKAVFIAVRERVRVAIESI